MALAHGIGCPAGYVLEWGGCPQRVLDRRGLHRVDALGLTLPLCSSRKRHRVASAADSIGWERWWLRLDRHTIYSERVLIACPWKGESVFTFWSTLSTGALGKAADIAGDLVPILAIIVGIPIGERVLHVIRRLVSR